MNHVRLKEHARQQDRGDLEIVAETTMAEVPRGRDGRERLRMTFTKARSADGNDVAWHSLRIFYRADDGSWRPGKQGVTIRGRELRPIAEAFARAVGVGAPTAVANPTAPDAQPQRPAGVRAPEHRETRARPAPPPDEPSLWAEDDDAGIF